MTAPAFIYTSEPWAARSFGRVVHIILGKGRRNNDRESPVVHRVIRDDAAHEVGTPTRARLQLEGRIVS
jgi:hypothetical protein